MSINWWFSLITPKLSFVLSKSWMKWSLKSHLQIIFTASVPWGSISSMCSLYNWFDVKFEGFLPNWIASVSVNIDAAKTKKLDLSVYNKVTIKVYVPQDGLTGSQDNKLWVKLQDGSSGEPWNGQAVKEQAVTVNGWQTLEFDFSDQKAETKFSRIVLQFNGENNSDQVIAYIDNIFVHR